MSGPWDKYSNSQPAANSGPWDKYATSGDNDTPAIPSGDNDISMAHSAVTGALASPGIIDELSGVVESGGRAIGLKGLGSGDQFNNLDIQTPNFDFIKNYREGRDAKRGEQDKAYEANPYSYVGGNIAGTVGTAFLPGLNIAEEANIADKVIKSAKIGGAYGLASSNADLTKGEFGQALKDTGEGAILGGGLQGAAEKKLLIPALGATYGYFNSDSDGQLGKLEDAAKYGIGAYVGREALKKGGEFVSNNFEKYLPKIGKAFADVPEDVTQKYLADRSKYQTTKSIEDHVNEINAIVQERNAGVAGAQKKLEEKMAEFKEALADQKTNVSDANNAFNLASQGRKFDLKNAGDSEDAVNTIGGAIQKLKAKVIQLSSDARDVLKNNGDKPTFPTLWLKNAYKEGIKKASFDGISLRAPIDEGARQVFSAMKKEYDRIAALGSHVKLSEVKTLIQQLDKRIDYTESFGGFNSVENQSLKAVRSKLNEVLGNASPEYKAKMMVVAKHADLLSNLNDKFGTPEKIITRVNSLDKDKSYQEMALLKQLQNHTGEDIFGSIDPKINAQRTVADPRLLRADIETLPEFGAKTAAEDSLAHLKGPDSRFAKEIGGLNDELSAAEQKRAELGTITEGRSQNVVKSFDRGNPSINDRRAIETVAPHLIDSMESSRVQNAFQKPITNGSRRAVVGKAIGGAVGALTGAVLGGPVGAAAGAVAGLGADKYAGQVFKGLLDGKISLQEFFANPEAQGQLGKYYNVLKGAASRGNKAFAATHFILQQTDPDYRKLIDQDNPNDQ